MVILCTVRGVSITQTILITAALLGRIATVLLLSIVQICWLLTLNCINISLANGFEFPPPFYVMNFLAMCDIFEISKCVRDRSRDKEVSEFYVMNILAYFSYL